MQDLISRQAAIDTLDKHLRTTDVPVSYPGIISALTEWLNELPSAQPETHEERTETHSCDCISRKDAIDAHYEYCNKHPDAGFPVWSLKILEDLPSAQPEPLSDAYTKAVWTWLLDYQIKAAELKGRYTPYEVLSWVANDWRKQHERSD